MSVFDARRSQQQSLLFVMGLACLCACTGGVGTPLVLKSDVLDGGSGGTGGSTAGRGSRVDAGIIDNDEPGLTSDCEHLDDSWRASYAADEKKLFEQWNLLRANPSGICPPLATPTALEWNRPLQCSARLLAMDEVPPKGPNADPSFSIAYPNQRSQEVQKRARLSESNVAAELVAFNVNGLEGIIDVLRETQDPGAVFGFCNLLTTGFSTTLGTARYGNVWVMDFGQTAIPPTTTPRPPTSGMGNPGPGNSGTGGR